MQRETANSVKQLHLQINITCTYITDCVLRISHSFLHHTHNVFPWISNVHIFSSCLPHTHTEWATPTWTADERIRIRGIKKQRHCEWRKREREKKWKQVVKRRKIIEIKFRFNFSAISILHFLSTFYRFFSGFCHRTISFAYSLSVFCVSSLMQEVLASHIASASHRFSQFSTSSSYYALGDGKWIASQHSLAIHSKHNILCDCEQVNVCVCVVKSFR